MIEPRYKAGDKFIVEVDSWDCNNEDYIVAQTLRIPQWGLDRLERYDEAEITRRFIERRIEELRKQIEAFERERDAICDAIRAIDGTREK